MPRPFRYPNDEVATVVTSPTTCQRGQSHVTVLARAKTAVVAPGRGMTGQRGICKKPRTSAADGPAGDAPLPAPVPIRSGGCRPPLDLMLEDHAFEEGLDDLLLGGGELRDRLELKAEVLVGPSLLLVEE